MADRNINVDRLCSAMQRSRLMLRRYREERREAVRQYVGSHWSEEGAQERVPVNLISLYISVVGRNLIAKNPRVLLSTFQKPHKAPVSIMQSWANKQIEKIRLANVLQRCVLDGLFSVGILKVALATPADSAKQGWTLDSAKPFAERVDLDDFVFDLHARDFSEVSYIGHRYRVPLDVVKDMKVYGKGRKDLEPSTDTAYNLEGDERISRLGRGYLAGDTEEFEDFVDLWEVYLPRHRVVLTLADDHLTGANGGQSGGLGEALRYQSWLGPASGPYKMLAYGIVPGNIMPKGPIQDLIDLHELTNRIYRKLGRQAERQKEVLLVQGGATEDGSRIINSSDGEGLRCDNPERSVVRTFGAPNQQNLQFALHIKELFAYVAGNLDMMGGLSPQSRTLGQDQMLAQNASRAIADMQDRTVSFVSDTIESLCWYWWHDPFSVMKVSHSLPGLPNISIERTLGPLLRQRGRWEDLDIKVDPYSMQHSTPQTKLQSMNQVVQTVILPLIQLLQAQGIVFDANAYLQKVASYLDDPDLGDILTIREKPQEQGGPAAPEKPGMPQQTTRTYERRSVGNDSVLAKRAGLMQTLEGAPANGTPQQDQQGA